MYKYKLMDNEDVIEIFDKLYVKQGNNEKTTSVILTNKRLLFLDYLVPDEGAEILRVTRGVQYLRYKEIYYQINLDDIKKINNESNYQVILNNNMQFEFTNTALYKLLIKNIR